MVDCLSQERPKLLALDSIVSRKTAFALASQAIASASNFTSTIVAARALTETRHFSIFVLIFSLLFLVNNVQMALVFKPMAIFGAALTGKDADRHFGAYLVHETVLVLCVLLVSLLVCAGTGAFSVQFCAGLLLFATMFLLQQYFRFLFFAKTQTGNVLFLDIVGHGLRIVLLVAAYATGRLTFENIFFVLAIPAALATLCGLLRCRSMLAPISARHAVATFRQSIRVSKWILSYSLVVWLHANAFFFLVAWVIGLSGPAILKACVNLLGPLNIFFIGLANLVLPIASKRFQSKEYARLAALINSMLLFCVAVTVLYGAVVVIKPDFFFSLFYGRQSAYAQYAALVPLFAVQHLLGAVNQSYVIGMEAMRQTRKIFVSYLAGTIFSLAVTLSLAKFLNLYGIAVCWCTSSALVTFLNRRFYRSRIVPLVRAQPAGVMPSSVSAVCRTV